MNHRTQNNALFPSTKLVVILLTASLGLTLASCYSQADKASTDTDESHAFTGIAGDKIGDDYVYYPGYEVYYIPKQREYVYYNGSTWVRTTTPDPVWARTITGSASVQVEFHDAPEHHHADISRQYPRNWQPATVTGQAAPTTNDAKVKGSTN